MLGFDAFFKSTVVFGEVRVVRDGVHGVVEAVVALIFPDVDCSTVSTHVGHSSASDWQLG